MMNNAEFNYQLMPKTYNNQEQRLITFKRMYWNQNQNRVMWQLINNEHKKPIVLFSIPKATGTSYHRIQEPIRCLINKYPNDYVFVYAEPASISDVMKCDILQLHRAAPCHDQILSFLQKLPKQVNKPIVVNNIDDLEYQIPKTHYLYKQWMSRGKDKMSKRMFSASDYNLITSWNYQKTVQRDLGVNVIKGKTHRFPNWIDYELPQWQHSSEKKQNDKIKIGWVGLVSHNVDLMYIHNIWKVLSQKYGDKIQFVLTSPKPDVVQMRDEQLHITFSRKKRRDQPDHGFTSFINHVFADITKSKITIVDALPLSQYGKLYGGLDISFIVVEPTKFNKAKSEIKITQSVINRRIPVYNNFGPYSQWDQKFRQYIKTKYGMSQEASDIRRFLSLCSNNIHDRNVVQAWVKSVGAIIQGWNDSNFQKQKKEFMQAAYEFNILEYGMYENIDRRKKFYDDICLKHNIVKS